MNTLVVIMLCLMLLHDLTPVRVSRLNIMVKTHVANSTQIPNPFMINYKALLQLPIVKRIENVVMTQCDHHFVCIIESTGIFFFSS